jgi:hypothetical protein
MSRLVIDLVPPAGTGEEEAEPARTEIALDGAAAPPAVGQRFAYVDAWERPQRGRVAAVEALAGEPGWQVTVEADARA